VKTLGIIGQWLGVALFLAALLVMIFAQKGSPCECVVVAGSFLFTVATKVRYYKETARPRKRVALSELHFESKGLLYGTQKGRGV
jgi:hypothetical protein